MAEELATLGRGEIGDLILQALVRKLMEKGVLSEDDVRAMLFDAAQRVDVLGDPQTPQAAVEMVASDLAPAFFGSR